jgi:hypothetical protein
VARNKVETGRMKEGGITTETIGIITNGDLTQIDATVMIEEDMIRIDIVMMSHIGREEDDNSMKASALKESFDLS